MSQIVLCPNCHAQNPPGQRICVKCGTRWCLRCGASVPSASRYCPKCGVYAGSEQQARAKQKVAISSQPPQAPITPPATTTTAPSPSITTSTSKTSPPSTPYSPSQQQPTTQTKATATPRMTQSGHSCPQCYGTIDIAEGRCLNCGLLLSKNMLLKMQMEAASFPTPPLKATPEQMHPTPSQQSTPWQQHHGGFITGRQPEQNTPMPNTTKHISSVQGAAHQGIPMPRPITQQITPTYSTSGYQAAHQQPQTKYSPSYNAPQNIPRTGIPPQTGIPIPRAAPSSNQPAMAYAASQPMPFPGKAPYFAPREQPSHISGRPAHVDKIAKGTRPAIGIPLLKILVIALIAIVGFVGIYYVVSYISNPASSETTSHETGQDAEPTAAKPSDITPPVISAVNIPRKTDLSALVTWTTDEAATSQVMFCSPDGLCQWTEEDKTMVAKHSVIIAGLTPNTTYHLTLKSTDANGNETNYETDNEFSTTAPIPIGTENGNRAPDFTLRDINNKSVSLQDFKGKIVMVNLWATWCGPCIDELPFFQEIYSASPDKLVVLAIHSQDRAESAKSFVENEGFTFPVLLDTERAAASKYTLPQGSGIPRTFFIDEIGIVRESQYGSFQSKEDIESILKSL